MKRATLLSVAVLVWASGLGQAKDFDLDGLKSKVPANWKEEKPSSSMRLAQYKVPGADDKSAAEVRIFALGGSAKANIDRWKGQFKPPEGKVTEFKVSGHPVLMLDISGTWSGGQPLNPREKPMAQANYRMIAAQFDGPKKSYQFILVGPAKTVEANAKAFEDFIKGFK